MAEDCERTLLRRELIRELVEEERSISELSERCGLSRKTIHSWKRRYEQEGLRGLEPKSRRPHRSPREAISRQWQEAVLELKTPAPALGCQEISGRTQASSCRQNGSLGTHGWAPITSGSLDA